MSGFASFDDYLAVPRVTALALSPDGNRLVAGISAVNEDGDTLVSALWELDPTARQDAQRLTRSAKGESAPAFRADGSLLFVSGRDPAADDDPPALWRLPAAGEAERVLSRPGGVSAVVTALAADTVVVAAATFPGAEDAEADEQRRTARKDLKVAAVLYETSPIRFWDHDLGPDELRLLATRLTPDESPVDLTPLPGRALDEAGCCLSPDGSVLITSWQVEDEPGLHRAMLVALHTRTGERRVLADEPGVSFTSPAVSPDGTQVVCERGIEGTVADIPAYSLWLIDLADGSGRELVADPDVWPGAPIFAADGQTLYYLADEQGQRPVFRLDPATGETVRVTASGHYANLLVAPDGASLYALRDTWDCPPRPVRLDANAVDGAPTELPAPGATDAPGTSQRLTVQVADGTEVGAWLALPDDAGAGAPAPLVLWMHGGPLASWNGWSWRWNPWLLVAKGYAVLLPDPALSTGYGAEMIRRGWGQWGGTPFTDLMSVTDAVVARPDIDETRTAAMGGSYGGYLANWVAGHTDRFRGIVTHASLWALEQFQGTTDGPAFWALEWGLPTDSPEHYATWSPHHFVDAIKTPMLVIHGDKDYRVPVGEAVRLWWDLQRTGVPSRYLYFPDEGHWILKPGNARVWYETVWAFLAEHVLGEGWARPSLL